MNIVAAAFFFALGVAAGLTIAAALIVRDVERSLRRLKG